jgi:phosphinothricin acetyltransferase
MRHLIDVASDNGIWSLYAAIFSVNSASIEFHKKCGFREIGYRERIAKDRFGKWQNTTLMEFRL